MTLLSRFAFNVNVRRYSTAYLYFDDVPSVASDPAAAAHLGAHPAAAAHTAPDPEVAAVGASADVPDIPDGPVMPEEPEDSNNPKSSFAASVAAAAHANFEALKVAAEPHSMAIASGLGAAGVVALVVMVRRRGAGAAGRHARHADLSGVSVTDQVGQCRFTLG